MDQSQGGNPFGRLIEFARPHKTGYIVSVVLAVLGVAFGIVPYFATARMTIELLSGNRDLSFYMVWCLISGGCFVLKAILMGISTRASHEATFEVLSEARRKIASKLTRVPMGYILNTPSGQLKNGMVERIEQLEVPLAHVIPEMTSNLLVPIAIIVYLFVLDWRMALVSLITIPVGMMCYMGMMKEYPKKYGEVVKAGNHMSATTVEYIGGIEVIKAFNQADNSYQKFTDAVHANADLILDWMKDTQKYSAIMMSVWPAALISVLPVGCLFYMSGSLSAANQRIKTCYMVMQDVNHQLFTESVMDEILLSLDNSDEEKVAHEAESIMESLHISEFRDAHPMSLSGGQKQRVAIASAIASDKQVIVFDEPTSGLDYRHMKKVAENLRELSSLGKTLFIVTHDPELIAECCNYFVFIENGKVLWSDGWNRISRERLQRFFAFEGD